jgi:hypothetical protein
VHLPKSFPAAKHAYNKNIQLPFKSIQRELTFPISKLSVRLKKKNRGKRKELVRISGSRIISSSNNDVLKDVIGDDFVRFKLKLQLAVS